jgi:hypothetical protein
VQVGFVQTSNCEDVLNDQEIAALLSSFKDQRDRAVEKARQVYFESPDGWLQIKLCVADGLVLLVGRSKGQSIFANTCLATNGLSVTCAIWAEEAFSDLLDSNPFLKFFALFENLVGVPFELLRWLGSFVWELEFNIAHSVLATMPLPWSVVWLPYYFWYTVSILLLSVLADLAVVIFKFMKHQKEGR